MEIHKVPSYQVNDWWMSVRDFLDAALNKYGMDEKFPLDCVLCDLASGKSQLWAIVDNGKLKSAIVTEVEKYPKGDCLILFLMGGESMEEWGDLLHNAMVKYADDIGAKWIETGSRRGIGKLFYDRLGYKRKYETYTYEVTK